MILSISKRLDFLRLGLWGLMLISLIASMRHVAWLYSTLELGSETAGWISAFSFDASVFLLTLIAVKYKQGTAQRRFIRVGIYANAVISVLANIMHGVEHQQELERVNGLLWQVIPYVFSFAVPMMVIFLAEVLSRQESELEAEQRKQEKKQVQLKQKVSNFVQEESSSEVHEQGLKVQMNRQDRLNLVRKLVQEGCSSQVQIVGRTGFSKSSVSGYVKELLESGELIQEGRELYLNNLEREHEQTLELVVNNQEVGT